MVVKSIDEIGAEADILRRDSDALLKSIERDGSNIQTLRTDTVIAAELRAEIGPLLDQIIKVMSKARTEGFEVTWAIQPDSFGRYLRCTEIAIKKQL